jgi:hypothetical protein
LWKSSFGSVGNEESRSRIFGLAKLNWHTDYSPVWCTPYVLHIPPEHLRYDGERLNFIFMELWTMFLEIVAEECLSGLGLKVDLIEEILY